MSIIDTLVTDRTQADVDRLAQLSAKGWDGMTADERGEWLYGPQVPMLDETGEQFTDADGSPLECLDGIQRGAYNDTDLNRVGAAVQYVADRLGNTGYRLSVSPRTDWAVGDIPTSADLVAYLAQLDALRGKLDEVLAAYQTESQYELPPTPPDMQGLTFQEANDVEKIIKAIHDQLKYMGDHLYWIYSGDVYAGEV